MLPNNHSQEDVITAPALKTLHLQATNLNVCPSFSMGWQIKMPQLQETEDRCQSQAQIKLMRRHYLSTPSGAPFSTVFFLVPSIMGTCQGEQWKELMDKILRTECPVNNADHCVGWWPSHCSEYTMMSVASWLIHERCCEGYGNNKFTWHRVVIIPGPPHGMCCLITLIMQVHKTWGCNPMLCWYFVSAPW